MCTITPGCPSCGRGYWSRHRWDSSHQSSWCKSVHALQLKSASDWSHLCLVELFWAYILIFDFFIYYRTRVWLLPISDCSTNFMCMNFCWNSTISRKGEFVLCFLLLKNYCFISSTCLFGVFRLPVLLLCYEWFNLCSNKCTSLPDCNWPRLWYSIRIWLIWRVNTRLTSE